MSIESNAEITALENAYGHAKEKSREGCFAEAATLFRQIATSPLVEQNRVPFYLLESDAHVNNREYGKAIEACKLALEIDRSSVIAWRSLGSALSEVGRNEEATEALTKSLSLMPSVTAFVYLGCVQQSTGQFSDAEQSFREALALDPDFDEAHYNLGCALRALGRCDEAIEEFRAAVAISPAYARARCAFNELLELVQKDEESR
jgi:tetratricopeptide (TPR) repeat protein